MERNFRFRISGLTFFIIILLNLSFTVKGIEYIKKFPADLNSLEAIITVASGIFLIFSTDAIGFIFSSIVHFIFNYRDGYNSWFTKNLGNLNEKIMNIYEKSKLISSGEFPSGDFEKRWKAYNTEQFLIYFFWHRPDGVCKNLNDWIERRQTAYFTSYTFITATSIATVISIILICYLGFTPINFWVSLFFIIMAAFIGKNGEMAKKDAIAVTDLYVEGSFNPKIKEILNNYPPYTKSKPETIDSE